jgi:hypothetical protein
VIVTLLIVVAVAAPKVGVTSVGLVAKTKAPEPVSSVTAAIRLALDGVARNVATPVAKPEIPVEIGKPEQFVRVPEAGVPKTGDVNVGEVNVLLVSVCEPVSVTTVASIEKAVPVNVRPVEAL